MDKVLNIHNFFYPLVLCDLVIDPNIRDIYANHIDANAPQAHEVNAPYQQLLEKIGFLRYLFVWQRQTIRCVNERLEKDDEMSEEDRRMEKLLDIIVKLDKEEEQLDVDKIQTAVERAYGCRNGGMLPIRRDIDMTWRYDIEFELKELYKHMSTEETDSSIMKCMKHVIAKCIGIDEDKYEVNDVLMCEACQSSQDAIIVLDNRFHEKFKDQIKQ